ncbi:MAG: hypothetical protein GY710_26295 [Desulfobacteraceae bacterium]|nr:hypothetical protein [Desulfobacteraceae bacterium]
MELKDPKIIAAIISAIVSVCTFIATSITKPFWERHFHSFKLKTDHQYEQRKKVKEAISKYKVQLLNSAESLNHRLWNFSENCSKGWHKNTNGIDLTDLYYPQSFCYRFLAFFAWCKKIEQDMVYLDSTISDKDDMEFIKYLKVFPQIFCDTALFAGKNYDSFHATDHFFKDDFLNIVDLFIKEKGVMTSSEFKNIQDLSAYEKVISYIGGISNNQTCLRWNLMHGFHFLLMAFLTKFGYDFQQTSTSKLSSLAKKTPSNVLLPNFCELLDRNHLNNTKEIDVIIKVLKKA